MVCMPIQNITVLNTGDPDIGMLRKCPKHLMWSHVYGHGQRIRGVKDDTYIYLYHLQPGL